VTEQADRLLAILNRFSKTPTDEELARVISFVDKHGERFTTEEVIHVREKLLELTSKTVIELAEAFERGSAKLSRPVYVDDFSELLPKTGLLADFVELTSRTEWATPYRAFSFLTVLGTLLGRQIHVDREAYRIWPSMVTLLIGPTGIRKTSAIEFAMKLAIEADVDRFQFLEKISPESVTSWLAQRRPAVGILYAPELTTVINKREYMRGLITDLTRLWDCPDVLPVELLSRKETLHEVALSFLGASNEEWLFKSLPEDAHKGGFFARMLQVYVAAIEKLVSKPAKMDDKLRARVVAGLIETRRCQGVAALTHAADVYVDARYREVMGGVAAGADPRLAAFMMRYHDHMMRMGMLLAVCEERKPSVVVGEDHLRLADGLIGWVTSKLPKIYAFTSMTDAGEDARRVLYVLARAGGRMSRYRLMGELYGQVTSQRLDEIVKTLQAADFVRVAPSVLFDNSPNRVYYCLTERALQEV